ncbi:response regulator [Flavobacterium sp. ov086]|uniref:response regulator n=1 Tax=Flavobacterium sp. ov086 TaxID=1761785 RepID=UPI000B7156CD|nr:response regulator [Flavobacterium sp. ov086]SNR29899.1 CheY chemotaxis protein or a CheY-like REC (receiver) domain [Flavobacterium sp. ov086]
MDQEIAKPTFKKILVIDDNPTDRYIAKRMAEKYLFAEEIILQESALEALEYIRSLENVPHLLPQIIFLDINMPGMNGYEFLDEYTKLAEVIRANCIILMITTSIHPDDLKRAQNNPSVFRFLNKPLDKEKFRLIEQEFSFTK